MKYTFVPIIKIDDLEKDLILQFGEDFLGGEELRNIMFDTSYINDVYCSYSWEYLSEGEDAPDYCDDEECNRINRCIMSFLKDTFPDYTKVLVDVSW